MVRASAFGLLSDFGDWGPQRDFRKSGEARSLYYAGSDPLSGLNAMMLKGGKVTSAENG